MSKKSRASTPHRLTTTPSHLLPSPGSHFPIDPQQTPLDKLSPQLIELNDSLGDLDSNIQSLQGIHESLTSFNESFGSFLYALQVNAYVVEFNEVPGNFKEFGKLKDVNSKIAKLESLLQERQNDTHGGGGPIENHNADDTYMTNDEDGSFIVQPKSNPRKQSTAPTTTTSTTGTTNSRIPQRRTTSIRKPTLSSTATGNRSGAVKDKRPPFR